MKCLPQVYDNDDDDDDDDDADISVVIKCHY